MSGIDDSNLSPSWEIEHNQQQMIVSRHIFENQEGQILALTVSGPAEDVYAYLELVRYALAFRTEPLDEKQWADYSDTTASSDLEKRDDPLTAPPTVHIQFEFPGMVAPYQWEVLFDPQLNVIIGGTTTPHVYSTTASRQIRATINADGGKLKMTVENRRVIVRSGNPSESLTTTKKATATSFRITVDGLDAHNQYDLYLAGASFA